MPRLWPQNERSQAGAARILSRWLLTALVLTVGIGGGLDEHNIGNEDDLAGGVVVHEYQLAPGGELDAAPSWWTASRAIPGRVEEGLADTNVRVPRKARQQSDGDDGAVLAPSASIRAIVCAEGTPWPCDWAVAVVDCESSGRMDAWATEVIRGIRYWFHGWFQIVSTSPDPGPLADPVYNTERAAWKYRNGGVGHWPGCP